MYIRALVAVIDGSKVVTIVEAAAGKGSLRACAD
jgi:hypothetical protein